MGRSERGKALRKAKLEIMGSIPQELRERDQWLGWQAEDDEVDEDAKPLKVPYDVETGIRTPTHDYNKWPFWNDSCGISPFRKAVRAAARREYDGIGFYFDAGDPYVGLDLDGVFDEEGRLEPWAKEIVDSLDSYTEISASGQGLHIIVRAELSEPIFRGPLIDIVCSYDWYFAMTGQLLNGCRGTIEDRHAELKRLCSGMIEHGLLRSGSDAWE